MKLKAFLMLIILVANSIYAETTAFLPKTFLILPEESIVKTKWILLPEQRNKSYNRSINKINLFINHKNEPVIIYENKLFFNPLSGYLVKLDQTIKDIICLDNGVLLASDGVNLGYLEIERDSDVLPKVKIKAFARLPLKDSKLYKGENTVYAVGFNKEINRYEVYLFNPKKSFFQKIVSFDKPVDALSGKEKHLFFSNDRVIKEYKNGNISLVYEHPRQKIEELIYNEKTGLIYKTLYGTGIIKNQAALEFLQTENPIIYLKETSLYIFFHSISGVLEIMNIDDLRNFAFKVQKIIDIQQTF